MTYVQCYPAAQLGLSLALPRKHVAHVVFVSHSPSPILHQQRASASNYFQVLELPRLTMAQ